jgi:hypothetical protein
MKHSSRPRIQPRLEVLEDRCTPSTMTDFLHAWEAINTAPPPNVGPALLSLLNSATQAAADAMAAANAATHTAAFKISGSGSAPRGLPEIPTNSGPHTATGNATELGKYTGSGRFTLLSIDMAQGTGTFQGVFTFVAANGDQLAMNYGADPSDPGHLAVLPAGNGQFYAVFVAEFTPNPALSTGRFADAIGGGFTMVAVSTPFSFDFINPPFYTTPFDYSWAGEGSLVFSNGH